MITLQVQLEPREVHLARVGFAFAHGGDLALFAAVQCCTPATHNQLELVDSFPAIGRDGALSRRRIVASAECAHEPLQCSLRTHFTDELHASDITTSGAALGVGVASECGSHSPQPPRPLSGVGAAGS